MLSLYKAKTQINNWLHPGQTTGTASFMANQILYRLELFSVCQPTPFPVSTENLICVCFFVFFKNP